MKALYDVFQILTVYFSGVFLCSVTGSVLYLYRMPIGFENKENGNPRINYMILKIVILSFLIPVALGIMAIVAYFTYTEMFWNITREIEFIIFAVGCVWLIGFVRQFFFFIRTQQKLKKIVSKCYSCDVSTLRVAKKCQQKLKIKRKVTFLQGYHIKVPMIFGIVKPVVLLPDQNYKKEELEIILLHELQHCKHHDLLWQFLANVVVCIHWFQPIPKRVSAQLQQWSEVYCDLHVLEQNIGIKEYYSTILQMVERHSSQRSYMAYCLYEESTSFEQRMKRVFMIKQDEKRPWVMAVLFLICFCLMGTASVSAATYGYYRGYHLIEFYTEEEIDAEEVEFESLELRERNKFHVKEIENTSTKLLNHEDSTFFEWNIQPACAYVSEEFEVESGTILAFSACTIKKQEKNQLSDSEGVLGIIEPGGKQRYVIGTRPFDANIEIKKGGKYRVFAENQGKYKLEFDGFLNVIRSGNDEK